MFKIGDILVGTCEPGGKYSITSKDAVLEVVFVNKESPYSEKILNVKVIHHATILGVIGETYWVDSKYFKLLNKQGYAKFVELQMGVSNV